MLVRATKVVARGVVNVILIDGTGNEPPLNLSSESPSPKENFEFALASSFLAPARNRLGKRPSTRITLGVALWRGNLSD